MNTKNLTLPPDLREMLMQHIVLLEPLNKNNNRFKFEIWTGGYQDMMFNISDLVKVCMLALESPHSNFPEIPEPSTNISGVLSLILNMLPYEEAELLDILHQSCLTSQTTEVRTPCDESYFLTPSFSNPPSFTDTL